MLSSIASSRAAAAALSFSFGALLLKVKVKIHSKICARCVCAQVVLMKQKFEGVRKNGSLS